MWVRLPSAPPGAHLLAPKPPALCVVVPSAQQAAQDRRDPLLTSRRLVLSGMGGCFAHRHQLEKERDCFAV